MLPGYYMLVSFLELKNVQKSTEGSYSPLFRTSGHNLRSLDSKQSKPQSSDQHSTSRAPAQRLLNSQEKLMLNKSPSSHDLLWHSSYARLRR